MSSNKLPATALTPVYRVIQYSFIASLAFAPYYFGGERLLAWGISGVFQSAIFLALMTLPDARYIRNSHDTIVLKAAGFFFAIAYGWAALQLIPLPWRDLVNPVWEMAGQAIERTLQASVAVSPDEGFLTLIKISIVLLTFLNAKILSEHFPRPYTLLAAIALIGAAYALLGMIWMRLYPEGHYWLSQSHYAGHLTSTYVNRNSFAQYAGMASLCAIACLLHKWKRSATPFKSIGHILDHIKKTFHLTALFLFVFLFLLISLLLTASRAGTLAVLVAYVVMSIGMLRIGKHQYLKTVIYICGALTAGYILFDFYSSALNQRNTTFYEDIHSRLDLYRNIWDLIMQRPWTGYGLGAFEAAFRAQMSIEFASPGGIWLRAHNVYLDTAVALGIPGMLCALIAVLLPMLIHFNRFVHNPSTLNIFAIALYVQLIIHSAFDFSLQAGANAMTAAALLGASLTETQRRRPVNQ